MISMIFLIGIGNIQVANKIRDTQLFPDDYITQNQLDDSNSINLSTVYWSNIFEFIKLINKYWADSFNISINNSVTALR